ncbi:MAG TPA: gamma-glutamyl-gamma-aminobutyrate hydrolase family protein [Acidobacteriaceae bacterium]|nr:gamma-glutamyl-gamma-aminobutyrate hydrolase family protein [Acidobacteriaceae bacterium]
MTRPRIAIPIPSMDPEYSSQAWIQYASAIERSGGEAVEVPLGEPPAATAKLIAGCQGILLPGSGADVNPQKYGQEPIAECAPADLARENVDELLLQDAHNMGKPIFTICFGTQMLNVWRGGTLVQHLAAGTVNHKAGRKVPIAHIAAVSTDSLLGKMVAVGEITEQDGSLLLPVNSSHHQAIGTAGDGLRVTARTPEDGVVEAIENTPEGLGGSFVVGVQWHPERTFDDSAASRALFARFIAEAAAWVPRPTSAPAV